MSRKSWVLFLASALCIAQIASATDEGYAIAGTGAGSCGKWLEGREMHSSDVDAMYIAWVQGFLSGMNTMRYTVTQKKMATLPDPPSTLAYVDKYCRDNPLDSVFIASFALYKEIETSK